MKIIRAFFAIDLPDNMRENLQRIIEQLPNRLPVRWSKPQNLHITLQFLRKVHSDDITGLIESVEKNLQDIPPFEIELNYLELFPSVEHPRFISIAPKPDDTLMEVAKRIGKGILAAHYPVETRIFRPHLTLGKLNSAPTTHLSFKNITFPANKNFWVQEISFYQSNPTADGSCYHPLKRIKLLP